MTTRKDAEVFFGEKGLPYFAWAKYETSQVMHAGNSGQTCVMARIINPDNTEKSYYAWGYYGDEEARVKARELKRVRRYQVDSVALFHDVEYF